MAPQDIFVGIVAVLTGLFVFASAAFQSQWIARFWVTRRIEDAANGSISRLVIMGVGALCTILGALLLLGFFPSDKSNAAPEEEASSLLCPLLVSSGLLPSRR